MYITNMLKELTLNIFVKDKFFLKKNQVITFRKGSIGSV